jgi:hypothetical protein
MTRKSLVIILPSLLVSALSLADGHHRHDHDRDRGDDNISVKVHDGQIEIEGIKDLVDSQIETALEAIDNQNMPPQLRDKLRQRLGKLRGTLDRRLGHMNAADLDQLGAELDKMGQEISRDMEGFGSDMDRWGKDFGRKLEKKLGQHHVQIHAGTTDPNDDDDDLGAVDVDDQSNFDDVVRDLGDLQLQQGQRDALARMRADSERRVMEAKMALETASQELQNALEKGTASDAEIARAIDAVSQQEATIRKIRILSWVNARRVLDDSQRRRVEGAAHGRTR